MAAARTCYDDRIPVLAASECVGPARAHSLAGQEAESRGGLEAERVHQVGLRRGGSHRAGQRERRVQSEPTRCVRHVTDRSRTWMLRRLLWLLLLLLCQLHLRSTSLEPFADGVLERRRMMLMVTMIRMRRGRTATADTDTPAAAAADAAGTGAARELLLRRVVARVG